MQVTIKSVSRCMIWSSSNSCGLQDEGDSNVAPFRWKISETYMIISGISSHVLFARLCSWSACGSNVLRVCPKGPEGPKGCCCSWTSSAALRAQRIAIVSLVRNCAADRVCADRWIVSLWPFSLHRSKCIVWWFHNVFWFVWHVFWCFKLCCTIY